MDDTLDTRIHPFADAVAEDAITVLAGHGLEEKVAAARTSVWVEPGNPHWPTGTGHEDALERLVLIMGRHWPPAALRSTLSRRAREEGMSPEEFRHHVLQTAVLLTLNDDGFAEQTVRLGERWIVRERNGEEASVVPVTDLLMGLLGPWLIGSADGGEPTAAPDEEYWRRRTFWRWLRQTVRRRANESLEREDRNLDDSEDPDAQPDPRPSRLDALIAAEAEQAKKARVQALIEGEKGKPREYLDMYSALLHYRTPAEAKELASIYTGQNKAAVRKMLQRLSERRRDLREIDPTD